MSDLNGQMIWIDVDQIEPPDDPRVCTEAEINDLAANIQLNQQLEPGMVEANTSSAKPWKLIFGWHRLQALQKLGYRQMKCEVRNGLTPAQRIQIILAENSKRSSASPFFQARLVSRLQVELRLVNGEATQKDLAQAAGFSESDVSDYLAIHLIPDDLKSQFDASNFSFKRLREIIRADNTDQLRQLSEMALQHSLTAGAIKAALAKLRTPSRGTKKTPPISKLWPGLPEGVQFKSQAHYHHLIWPEGLYSKALVEKLLASAPESITPKRQSTS